MRSSWRRRADSRPNWEADPQFVRVLQLLRQVQAAGAFRMQVKVNPDKSETAQVIFKGESLSPEIAAKFTEIRQLLKLPEGHSQYTLVYSPAPGGPGELAVGSRSMLQIMAAMASYTDVPQADIKDGRAVPFSQSVGSSAETDPVHIKCSKEKPTDAFAKVHYQNQWFWVDNRDWRTKRAFSAIMFLFTMAQDAGEEKLPLITIPAQ